MNEQTPTEKALALLDQIDTTFYRSFGYDVGTRNITSKARRSILAGNHLAANGCGTELRRSCGKLGADAADAIKAAMKPLTDAFAAQWRATLEANANRYDD